MSIPIPPQPAKLVIGIFLKDKSLLHPIVTELSSFFGTVDSVSPCLPFDFTSYYEAEMGTPLFRRLFSFKKLIDQEALATIKIKTNELETYYAQGKSRRVNIDPGYLLGERFVLATGKNFTHRIYIGQNIYADLTLIFQKGDFKLLPWTYPDYAAPNMHTYLGQVRKKYLVNLKTAKIVKNGNYNTTKKEKSMIKSMTGYAKTEEISAPYVINTEIRSLNSRHLDIVLRIPHRYIGLEEKIKGFIAGRLDRGRIEISVKVKDESEEAYVYEANLHKASAYHKAISQLNDHFKLDGQLSIDHLLGIDGIITTAEPKDDLARLWSEMEAGITLALDKLIEMRMDEGEHLAEDLLERIALLENHIRFIDDESVNLLNLYQARLKERIEKLTEGLIEIEPFRIAQEAAFLADRSDVSEEIVRIKSHLKQLKNMTVSTEPVGRKINFIIQELNREFNTLGSKTGNTDVSYKVVELKSELEKIREQVQNIE